MRGFWEGVMEIQLKLLGGIGELGRRPGHEAAAAAQAVFRPTNSRLEHKVGASRKSLQAGSSLLEPPAPVQY